MAPISKWFRQRITEYYSTVGNWLGRVSSSVRTYTYRTATSLFSKPSTDWGRADYDFWKRAYLCRVRGLELSGLFIKPLVNKVSGWTLGRAPNWKLENEAASKALSNWWNDHHAEILRADRQSRKLGDEFIVVNPDLTLTLVPPDLVDPIVADDDYGEIIGWRITQTLQHPQGTSRRMVVVDEYYDDRRVHEVQINGVQVEYQEYPNLIGIKPVVHIANLPDEQPFGHPEAEALVEVLQRYNTTLTAGLEGNEMQGRPTPVLEFDSVPDMEKFWELYGVSETQTLPDGTTETQTTLEVDLNQILTLSGGKFGFASPGQFAGDTERLLGLMFYLILEHTEIPEFVFGNAISSSQASANTQMPVWIRFIEGRQTDASGWLLELATIVLGFLALMQPGVAVETKPILQWDPIDDDDGNLTLMTIQWLYAEGLIDERTAVMLSPVGIEDIDAVLAAAQEERDAMQPDAPRGLPSPFKEDEVDQALANEIEALEIAL